MALRVIFKVIFLMLAGSRLSFAWSSEVHSQISHLAIRLLSSTESGDCLVKNEAAINDLVGRAHEAYAGEKLEIENHYFHLDSLLGKVTPEALRRLPLNLKYHEAYPIYRNLVREQRVSINQRAREQKRKPVHENVNLEDVTARGLAAPRVLELYAQAVSDFKANHFKRGFFHFSLLGHYLMELAAARNVTEHSLVAADIDQAFEKNVRVERLKPEFDREFLSAAKKNGGRHLELENSAKVPQELFDLASASFFLKKTPPLSGDPATAAILLPKQETVHLVKSAVVLARVWNRAYLDSVDGKADIKREWNRCPLIDFEEGFLKENYPKSWYLNDVLAMLGFKQMPPDRALSGGVEEASR